MTARIYSLAAYRERHISRLSALAYLNSRHCLLLSRIALAETDAEVARLSRQLDRIGRLRGEYRRVGGSR